MTIELITALMTFAFVSSITLGPNNLMLMTSGINFGLTRSLPHMLGVGLGFTAMIFLIGLGLTRIFDAFPIIYQVLKVISIVYLSYLAWKIATATSTTQNQETKTGKPLTFMQAALFQWVNPKAWIMGVSAISTYAAAIDNQYAIVIISAIFFIMCIPSISAWTILGVQLQRFLNNPKKLKIFNVTAALLLIASLYPIIFS